MTDPEFDKYAEKYDDILGGSIPDSLNEDSYFAEYKISLMAKLLGQKSPARILDFGCGSGRSLPFLLEHFPYSELWGYDVSVSSTCIAAKRVPSARFFSDWSALTDKSFDVIIAANVFHHIPASQQKSALSSCFNSLAVGGKMFIFEHNPYNPATRWVFERCPFDEHAKMISLRSTCRLARSVGFSSVEHGYTLFFPRPLGFLRPFEPFLKRLPLGAQYYVQMAK